MDHRNKDSRAESTKLIRRAEGDAKYLTDMDKQVGWKGAIDELIDEYFFQMFTGQELADIYGVSFEEFDKMPLTSRFSFRFLCANTIQCHVSD